MIIDGRLLTWEQGTILNTGVEQTTSLVIRTADFLFLKERKLALLAPFYAANNVSYSVFVAQYDAGQQYISRISMISSGAPAQVQLDANCVYVKFTLGHSSTQGVNTSTSEGAAIRILAVDGGMPLKDRRRMIMALDTEYIKGSDFTWQQGTISSTGGKSSSNAFIRMASFYAISGKTLTYIEPVYDINNNLYSRFLCQYSSASDTAFIKRTAFVYADNHEQITLESNCTHIKLVLGHPSATGLTTVPSEGAAIRIKATR